MSLLILLGQTPAFATPCTPALNRLSPEFKSIALSQTAADEVARELYGLIDQHLGQGTGAMWGSEFNRFLRALRELADRAGIELTTRADTIGVFPRGLKEIAFSGFGDEVPEKEAVSYIARHELGHLVHTLQTRLILLRSLEASGQPLTPERQRKLDAYLEHLEGGNRNYMGFEQAVTGLASPIHRFRPRASELKLYRERMVQLIQDVERAVGTGRMRPAVGRTPEEVYALFISRAPLVVGKSLGGLAVRLPFYYFMALVALNMDMRRFGLKPETWGLGIESDNRQVGFRDFVYQLLVKSWRQPQKSAR